MKVRGIPAALAAITAALTLIIGTNSQSPQVRTQPVDNSVQVLAGPTAGEELRQIRASRSRRPNTANTKNTKTNKVAAPVVKPSPRSKPVSKPVVKKYVQPSVSYSSAAAWAASPRVVRLRNCESGGNYRINTGNGYYGAYQFNLQTWRGLGFSGYPHLASKAVQDAAAYKCWKGRGFQPWPHCGFI